MDWCYFDIYCFYKYLDDKGERMIPYICTNEMAGNNNNFNLTCLVIPHDPRNPFRELRFWKLVKFKILHNRHVCFLLWMVLRMTPEWR